MKDDNCFIALATRIANEEDLREVLTVCESIFSEIFSTNAKNLISETREDYGIQEKCLLFRETLKRHGVTQELNNEDLCNLATKVFAIKISRGA